jgi:hypothetical protein
MGGDRKNGWLTAGVIAHHLVADSAPDQDYPFKGWISSLKKSKKILLFGGQ